MARTKFSKACPHCGQQFFAPETRLKYCSMKCYSEARTRPSWDRFWEKVDKTAAFGCWLWIAGTKNGGYGDSGQSRLAHRDSWELHNGPIPDGMCVLHNCDAFYPKGDITNRRCVNPVHLFLGSRAENMADMIEKGRQRHARGEDAGKAKLSDAQVLEIRAADGRHEDVAARFGVTPSTISHIKTRRTWKHLA